MSVLRVKLRYIPVKMMPRVCVLLQNTIKVIAAAVQTEKNKGITAVPELSIKRFYIVLNRSPSIANAMQRWIVLKSEHKNGHIDVDQKLHSFN